MSACTRTSSPGKASRCQRVTPSRASAGPIFLLVDLREGGERAKHGLLPGALHAPYPAICENLRSGGMLREVAAADRPPRRVLLRLRRTLGGWRWPPRRKKAGLANTAHIEGGIDAWKKAGGPVVRG